MAFAGVLSCLKYKAAVAFVPFATVFSSEPSCLKLVLTIFDKVFECVDAGSWPLFPPFWTILTVAFHGRNKAERSTLHEREQFNELYENRQRGKGVM